MRKMAYGLLAVVMGALMLGAPAIVVEPVSAASCYCKDKNDSNKYIEGVQTNFFGVDAYEKKGDSYREIDGVKCSCDAGDGGQVTNILYVVINVISVCIGVLAVLGIVITGFQYLTAGGNEEQVRKAKKRLIDIVIGLVVYVLIYAFLTWLLPAFPGSGTA